MSGDRRELKGRGRFISTEKPIQHEPLRRPGECTPNKDSFQGSAQQYPIASSLSPMAAEFVPKSCRPVAVTYAEPSTQVATVNGENLSVSQENLNVSPEDLSVSHVRTIMYEIMVNPGKFDSFSTVLVEALSSTIKDEQSLKAVVYEIFEQAVIDSSFSYNGARLCNHLYKHLTVPFGEHGFRDVLFARCKEEFGMKDSFVEDPNLASRLCGFTMFIGELFIHLELDAVRGSAKVSLLGKIVVHLLETLLSKPTTENIKCVCQMLKFTGGDLEDYDISEGNGEPLRMNKIFQLMNRLSTDGNTDRNSRILLNNLIELRARNWDRVHSYSNVSEEHVAEIHGNGPVLYGPDGLPISSEEVHFLESNLCSSENGIGDDVCSDIDYYSSTQNPGLWSTNEDIDEEIAEEFEKFLLENS